MNDLFDLVARAGIWKGVGHLMAESPILAAVIPAAGVVWYLVRGRRRGRRRAS